MDRNFVCLWGRHKCNWSLAFCADLLIYLINYWVLNNSNLHAKISTLLIHNLHWVKTLFCCIRRNNVGQQFKSLEIIQLHALSLTKNGSNHRSIFFLYMDPAVLNLRNNEVEKCKCKKSCLTESSYCWLYKKTASLYSIKKWRTVQKKRFTSELSTL